MKNLCALLLVLLLAVVGRGAAAQESLSAPGEDVGALPPDDALVLPSGDADAADAEAPSSEAGSSSELVPVPEGVEEGMMSYLGGPMQALECTPSYFESSGSWLRRGYWYTEADLVLLNRGWDRKGLLLAFEGTTSTAPGFVQPGLGVPGFGQILAIDTLTIDGSMPGETPLARVKLGHFLFRDSLNRDHTVEGSYYGGGVWRQRSGLNATSAAGLQIPNFIDRDNPSFDGATSMRFDYQTDMNSGELNYAVKQRMQRDQMQLRPNGEWVRVANPSRTYSFLTGARVMRLTDDLFIGAGGYNADNINPPLPAVPFGGTTPLGAYRVETKNNLLGAQIGGSYGYETGRWSLGASAKGGAYYNRMTMGTSFNVNGPVISNPPGLRQNDLSFIGEFQVLGKWHLRPNMSLRAGFEILYVDSLALAPHQVNFVSAPAGPTGTSGYVPIANDGDIFAIGSSVGFEIYR